MPPDKVLLVPDDYHLGHAGRCADGRNVLVASQLTFAAPQTRDFVCTFWFDSEGRVVEHRIDEVGIRGEYNEDDGRKIWDSHILAVGAIDPQPFWVKPFSIQFADQAFGFIPREMDNGEWQVTFEPGNTMAFYAPWDSGEYDT